jgi:hypothetical protein
MVEQLAFWHAFVSLAEQLELALSSQLGLTVIPSLIYSIAPVLFLWRVSAAVSVSLILCCESILVQQSRLSSIGWCVWHLIQAPVTPLVVVPAQLAHLPGPLSSSSIASLLALAQVVRFWLQWPQ